MTVGDFNPVLGTHLSDPLPSFPADIFYLEGNNLEIVYGLEGDDFLSTNEDLTSDDTVILLGGEGNDEYFVRENSAVVILETGNSGLDTIVANGYKINGDNTYSLIIDDRHLYTADLDTDTYFLILDWQSNTVVDEFILEDGTFTFQETTEFFARLVSSGDENFLGNFTWDEVQTDEFLVDNDANIDLSALGLSSDTIDDAIDDAKATEDNFQSTIAVFTSGDNIEGLLTTADNSYIFNEEIYYYDFYSLEFSPGEELIPGDVVKIDLTSADFNPLLFVLDSRGNVIDVDTDGDLTFAVGSGEPFFISVESRTANATGDYDLSIDVLAASASNILGANQPIVVFESLEPSDSINDTLTADDIVFSENGDRLFADIYSLTGALVGDEIQVTLDADFDGEITITAFDNDFEIVDDRSFTVDDLEGNLGFERAIFTVESGFDYVIGVNGSSLEALGDYVLTTEIL